VFVIYLAVLVAIAVAIIFTPDTVRNQVQHISDLH
jgi:hypothetical protein